MSPQPKKKNTETKPEPAPAAPPLVAEADDAKRLYLICQLVDAEGKPFTDAPPNTHPSVGEQLKVLALLDARSPDQAVRAWVESQPKADPREIPKHVLVIADPAVHAKSWKPRNVKLQLEIT